MFDCEKSDVDEAIVWSIASGTIRGLGEDELWDGSERIRVRTANKNGSFSDEDEELLICSLLSTASTKSNISSVDSVGLVLYSNVWAMVWLVMVYLSNEWTLLGNVEFNREFILFPPFACSHTQKGLNK